MTEERLQKILAQAGYGSRRACEAMIIEGRVKVNGQVAVIGSKADPAKVKIEIDGHKLSAPEEPIYIAVYKPRGIFSDKDVLEKRQNVRDLVPVNGHLFPVGRLDVDSEGLMLLTNDGDLANKLTHPRYGHEKEYRVLVARKPDEEQLATWRRGVVLEDGSRTLPAKVNFESSQGKGAWLRIELHEGRKRQIRETGKTIGLPVVKILRVRIGKLLIGDLKPRQWRYLTQAEIDALKGDKSPDAKTEKSKAKKSTPARR